MTLICQRCQTENRDIAKFCINCVSPFPTAFAPIDFANSYLLNGDAGAMPSKREERRPSLGPLMLGAVGWLLAGAGALYIYKDRTSEPEPPPAVQSVKTVSRVVDPRIEPADPTASATSR